MNLQLLEWKNYSKIINIYSKNLYDILQNYDQFYLIKNHKDLFIKACFNCPISGHYLVFSDCPILNIFKGSDNYEIIHFYSDSKESISPILVRDIRYEYIKKDKDNYFPGFYP